MGGISIEDKGEAADLCTLALPSHQLNDIPGLTQ